MAGILFQCRVTGLSKCKNHECTKRQRQVHAAAPSCSWLAFRDFILTPFSCDSLQDSQSHSNFSAFLEALNGHMSAQYAHSGPPQSPCMDLFGINDILRWVNRLVFPLEVREGDTDLFHFDFTPRIDPIASRCHTSDVCPTRVWNVALQSTEAHSQYQSHRRRS